MIKIQTLEWVTDGNRAFVASRRLACETDPELLKHELNELARRYERLAIECRNAVRDIEQDGTTLQVIDQALRNSQRGYDPVVMAAAVFNALDLEPEAELVHEVRRIIQRNLMDTDFNRMAEDVTAAIQHKEAV